MQTRWSPTRCWSRCRCWCWPTNRTCPTAWACARSSPSSTRTPTWLVSATAWSCPSRLSTGTRSTTLNLEPREFTWMSISLWELLKWVVGHCVCPTREGVDEGILWLVQCIERNSTVRPPRNHAEQWPPPPAPFLIHPPKPLVTINSSVRWNQTLPTQLWMQVQDLCSGGKSPSSASAQVKEQSRSVFQLQITFKWHQGSQSVQLSGSVWTRIWTWVQAAMVVQWRGTRRFNWMKLETF